MKKRIFTILSLTVLMVAASLKAEAQILIVDEQEYLNSDRNRVTVSDLPQMPIQGVTTDQYAPVGSGILVLGCLGGAYLLGKRRKKD